MISNKHFNALVSVGYQVLFYVGLNGYRDKDGNRSIMVTDNKIVVPRDMCYEFIFKMFGVDDDAVRSCCREAMKTIEDKIDWSIRSYRLQNPDELREREWELKEAQLKDKMDYFKLKYETKTSNY